MKKDKIFYKGKITLAKLIEKGEIVKIEEGKVFVRVYCKDGKIQFFAKFVDGKCPHIFTSVVTRIDGKHYVVCDMEGCDYEKELSKNRVGKFKKAGFFEDKTK